jgi:transposase
MPTTNKLEPHLNSDELENRYREAKDSVLRSHYQIVWHISLGKTTRQVMEVTGYSRGWIQQLPRRYNAYGLDALGDRRHHNPSAKERALLSAEQQEALKEALKKPPPDGGMWNSPKVGEWIEQRTGKVLSQKKQRGWEYMSKLGNSPKVPRPRHKKVNNHEQEAFKKSFRWHFRDGISTFFALLVREMPISIGKTPANVLYY